MKILYHILYPEGMGDDRFIYEGYKFAFKDIGHSVRPLTEREDLEKTLEAYRPNIFITRQSLIREYHISNVSNFLDVLEKFRKRGGRVIFEIGYEMPDLIVSRIKNGTIADVFFIHGGYSERPLVELISKPYFNLPLAANRRYHFPAAPIAKYSCDIIYIGANLPRKRAAFKRLLLPLFKKYNVRVYGGDWGFLDRYVMHPAAVLERRIIGTGLISRLRINQQVPLNEENIAYASAKICLNFHEDNHVGFVNGRTFKIAACAGFQICDWEPAVRQYFTENEVVMPKTADEWFKAIDYYLMRPEERERIRKKASIKALSEHTYHHRARTMLSWLNHA